MSVQDHLAVFQNLVRREITIADPDPTARLQLVGIYISRDNKRHIEVFIQVRTQELVRVRYIMPMSATSALALYGLNSAQEHTLPVFTRHPIPPGQTPIAVATAWAAVNNVSSWPAEINRVATLEAAMEVGKRKRLTGNLLHYWRIMQTAILRNLSGINVRDVASSSVRTSDSAPRPLVSSTPKPTPDPI